MEMGSLPTPVDDWITLTDLARHLGIGLSTASRWRSRGELDHLEHGFRPCGHRRYSRSLVNQHIRRSVPQPVGSDAPNRTSRRASVPAKVSQDDGPSPIFSGAFGCDEDVDNGNA